MQALPVAAFFLFLEVAAGGTIALMLLQERGDVSRGFLLFTAWILALAGVLALWLRLAFPPSSPLGVDPILSPVDALWLTAEHVLLGAFVVLLVTYLLGLQTGRLSLAQLLAPVVALLALASLWSAALVQPSPQLFGLGAPLAVLAGGVALGASLVGLSLGHWYLVSPSMSVEPLVQVNFLATAAVAAQVALQPLLLLLPGLPDNRLALLFTDYVLFLGVRWVFGLAVPLVVGFMTWRTARIRSLDSATGLLYIMAALILTGEIVARTLFLLSGVAT